MTRHGVNLVLSIGACELAPGAPRLQGARPLGNRGMSLLGTNAKCQPHRGMSEFGGEAENICSHRVFRILTHLGHLPAVQVGIMLCSVRRH